jgi:glycosyltransferase involved in cell wall biosynthesis
MAKVRVRMRSLRLRSLRMFRGLWARLKEAVAERDSPNVRLMKQPGKGKGDAVRAGFAEARGDILMILDADLTVPAEMLPRFYEAVASGRAEFANGTRLVYQMDDRAMRFLNLLGNHFFAFGFRPRHGSTGSRHPLWNQGSDT